MSQWDVVIIGAGAAGLMCAIEAGKRGRSVLLIDHAKKPGRKILMSGGGRCNFTNMYADPEAFVSHNPHFCKSALARYTQWDFLELVNKHGIAYHEKTLGQWFCDDSSKDILNMLLAEADQAGVKVQMNTEVTSIDGCDGFTLETNQGLLQCKSLVIATGGLSIPKMGATSFGYQVAEQFGMKVLPTRAGLVPFTFSDQNKVLFETLSGVSVDALVGCGDQSFRENILFTHRGLSGPAVLQISSYWREGDDIVVNLLPDQNAGQLLEQAKAQHGKQLMRTVLVIHLPKALVNELEPMWWPSLAEKPLAEWPNDALNQLAEKLSSWQLRPSGTEGYRTAEVTLGGVDTDDLSSKTMESKTQPGLYFIGEVVDVTGHLGGYNFQWAWSSGWVAGQVV